MALGLITNTSSSVAQRNLDSTNKSLNSTLEKLSSGLRVNRASDDVAAMAIGSRLNAELEGLRTVATNAGQATSLLQIAEGAYARTNDILVRMKSLAAQSANGTLSNTERSLLDVEFQALVSEVDRLADDTKFNGQALINNVTDVAVTGSGTGFTAISGVIAGDAVVVGDGVDIGFTAATNTFSGTVNGVTYTGVLDSSLVDASDNPTRDTVVKLSGDDGKSFINIALDTSFDAGTNDADFVNDLLYTVSAAASFNEFDFRVGTGAVSTEDVISATIGGIDTTNFGFDNVDGTNAIAITTVTEADLATEYVDAAIDGVVGLRADIGATQNRIETARTNLATTIENTEAAKSSYLDADIPSEITKFTAQQVLLQSGISTLAQANQIPQNLLSLFQ